MSSHWDAYWDAVEKHPELIEALQEEIRNYSATRDEFTSTAAGRAILSRWARRDDWMAAFPSNSKSMFGMALYEALKDEWDVDNSRSGVKVYKRKRR